MKTDETKEQGTYTKIVYVQFEGSTKSYSFGSNIEYKKGQNVVVETIRGKEIGTVCAPTIEFDPSKVKGDIKPMIRLTTEYDLVQKEENKTKAAEAMTVCRKCVENLGLDMHLINSEYTLDRRGHLYLCIRTTGGFPSVIKRSGQSTALPDRTASGRSPQQSQNDRRTGKLRDGNVLFPLPERFSDSIYQYGQKPAFGIEHRQAERPVWKADVLSSF